MPNINNHLTRAISAHITALTRHLAAIPKSDSITHVHEARVAARRLRVALWLMKKHFSGKTRKKWVKSLRRLSRALSEARDRDVHIEFLKNLSTGSGRTKKQKQEIAALIDFYKNRRRAGQAAVIKEAKRFTGKNTIRELSRSTARISKNPETLSRLARKKIIKSLRDLLAYEPYVKKPKAKKQLHLMRIAAKRLRYTLELLCGFYQGQTEKYTKRLIEIQRALGGTHEFDVWIEQTHEFTDNKKISRLIKRYRKEYEKLRHGCYEKFVRLWQENKKIKTWQGIYEMASSKNSK